MGNDDVLERCENPLPFVTGYGIIAQKGYFGHRLIMAGISLDYPERKLRFAQKRLEDLLRIIPAGGLGAVNTDMRQQLMQEFLFHLCGSIETVNSPGLLPGKERHMALIYGKLTSALSVNHDSR